MKKKSKLKSPKYKFLNAIAKSNNNINKREGKTRSASRILASA